MGTPSVDDGRGWAAVLRAQACGFLAAVQFLTIAPPLVRRLFTGQELGRAVGYFAVVGVLLGGLLWTLERLFSVCFPSGVTAALVLVAWVLCSGALHLDGFLDTCDGLFGGHTPEDRLRILRDERVGAFAVIGGVLLLLVKYQALCALGHRSTALLLAPALGRWGMALAVVAFAYARAEGLGRAMKDHAGWRQAALVTATAAVAGYGFGGVFGLIALLAGGAFTWLAARFVLRRLPGLTGDLYGAVCELVEVLALLVFLAAERG
jgi:adenosylcobinamide-GDP ribazoletransferase